MRIGDLVIKVKGINKGTVGVIVGIFNREVVQPSRILEVLCDNGSVLQWYSSWCEVATKDNVNENR